MDIKIMTNTNKKGHIYVRLHYSYDIYNACKLGKTENIPDRDSNYATGEIKRGHFELVFEVNIEEMGSIERLLQEEFCEWNIRIDGGKEFYNIRIMSLIEPCLIKHGKHYKKLSKEEINELIRTTRESKQIEEIYNWNERKYQTTTITMSKNELLEKNKIYIELPTGGGKSYIVYNLFYLLKSEFIIIVSPRKIVNSQNILSKYLQILKEKYELFNYSIEDKDKFEEYLKSTNKKIICCCTQSINKIYKYILSNHITNISIWFDEAHWGVEEWLDNSCEDIQFWLLDEKYIKYRIFTSASPNKEKVEQNEAIFGKLYSPIKVKELIDLKWLTPIKPYVYSENKTNVNNITHIIYDFNEQNKMFGFSFHYTQKNAFNLFYKHYLLYKNHETHIKPFLLVSNSFTIEREAKLEEIRLDYDYRNITVYESSCYSIGYVVAKYSMGYDFKKLDFICFSDPKLSIQDIKQCIGRGIRPDELGVNGSNKEKILTISLPIYIDENGDNKYDKIIEVFKYLLYDIEITMEEIEFKNRYTPSFKEGSSTSNEYIGVNDVESILLNLLELENKKVSIGTTYEKARKIIQDNNIQSRKEYSDLCDVDNRLSKNPDELFKGQFTNWIDYLSIERKYYELEECKMKVNEYLSTRAELKKDYLDLEKVCINLCELDTMFPPYDLWIDYYKINKLEDIIDIKRNKKRKSPILSTI